MDEAEKAKLKSSLRNLRKKREGSKHSVNFYLLVLIIILMVALVAAYFYFYWRHGELQEENKSYVGVKSATEDQLGQCQSKLDAALETMEIAMGELNISSSSRESLNELYINLSNEKAAVVADLTNTQSSLSTCQFELTEAADDLRDAIDDLNAYIDQYNAKVQELQKVQNKVDTLEATISSLNTEINDLESDLRKIRNCVEDHNCTACDSL